MKYNLLQTLGLENDEAAVYQVLCMEGRLTLAGIARKTGLHRPRLYKLLPTLVKKGFLCDKDIGKRTYYKAVEPRQLYDLLQQQLGSFSEEIDQLQDVYERQSKKPDVSFYLGEVGYKKLFDDIADSVPKGNEICRYSARRVDEHSFHTSPKYKERRAKGHLNRLIITSEAKAATKHKRLDAMIRVVPESFDMFDDNVSMIMYEDRTALVDHDNDSVFIIRSKKVASFQRKVFAMLWKHLPEPKKWKKEPAT